MLTVYGAAIITLMMVFYALESRSRWFTFAFALAWPVSDPLPMGVSWNMAIWSG